MQHNFKIGDKVRVIGKDPLHQFKAGEIVEIKKLTGWIEGRRDRCLCANNSGDVQSVGFDDLEPMPSTIQNIEIKDGYLLVCKQEEKTFNMTVLSNKEDDLCCVSPKVHWFPVNHFNSQGVNTHSEDIQVQAIYGRTRSMHLLDNSTEYRELLWERKEPKKMTVKEISDALGYDVEIIK